MRRFKAAIIFGFMFFYFEATTMAKAPELRTQMSSTPLELPDVTEQGRVDILVSDLGSPKDGFFLKIDGKPVKTNKDGFVSQKLNSGSHKVQWVLSGKVSEVPFSVVTGERTQVLINLLTGAADLTEPPRESQAMAEANGPKGKVQGEVRSTTGELLKGVRIFVKNTSTDAVTTGAGRFRLQLPVGQHTLSLTHPKYSTEILRSIEVKEDATSKVEAKMTPAGLVLDDFVVLAPRVGGSIEALIEVRRKSTEVADVMSAEQISKTGDGDAAGSLRRVTGLTLVDGKYVYVRGLGERYSSTLFNGISLPSPDPFRRVVPMDIFPVQILDSLVIQKSFSPDMPGEFGGGTVVLNTKSLPDKFFAKVSLSQSQHSGAGRVRTYESGSRDWLGTDNRRAMPSSLEQGAGDPNVFLDRNRHQITEEGPETLPELSLAFGDGWKMRPIRLGYTVSAAYKDEVQGNRENRNRYIGQDGGGLRKDETFRREKFEKTRNLGGIASVSATAYKHQKINTTYALLRKSTDYVAEMEGVNEEGNRVRQTDREWAERELRSLMIQGENKIPGLRFIDWGWHYADSSASRYEPDKVVDLYTSNGNGSYNFAGINDRASYQRRFFDLRDKAQDLALHADGDFPWFYGRKGNIELGVGSVNKRRQSAMRRFVTAAKNDGGVFNSQSQFDGSEGLDQLIGQCQFQGERCFEVTEATRNTDRYTADQSLQSYYFKTQWPLLRSLKLSTGMRYENSIQRVETLDQFKDESVMTRLQTRNWLPGSVLTYGISDKMQVRLAQSETVSRPDFKELSQSLWRDFELGYDVEGNPSLQSAVISAYDLRWEWYFALKENVSFGVFYKEFENPVEQIFTQGSDPRITFVNALRAENLGAEIELSKNLGFIGSWLNKFTLSGNYAWIQSEISLENAGQADLASPTRPLQGQSNYTANLLLDYAHEPAKLNLSLAYNVYGKRIALLDPNGNPDIYEQPFHQVDFVASKSLSQKITMRAKIGNLLNSKARFTQGGNLWRDVEKGMNFSIGIGMEI